MCETSNSPAPVRTSVCSRTSPVYRTGISKPPKSMSLAPAATWKAWNGVRLTVSVRCTWGSSRRWSGRSYPSRRGGSNCGGELQATELDFGRRVDDAECGDEAGWVRRARSERLTGPLELIGRSPPGHRAVSDPAIGMVIVRGQDAEPSRALVDDALQFAEPLGDRPQEHDGLLAGE